MSATPIVAGAGLTETDLRDLLPKVELVETDGMPMDSAWHRKAMNQLIEQVEYHLRERQDFYVGGNMFIYFSEEQAEQAPYADYRGPDFYFVDGVPRHPIRRFWVVWKEGGRYPNFIAELVSPSTAREDRTTKKDIYERIFRTPEYFLYDPETKKLEGWRLRNGRYEAVAPDQRGWLWSEQLQLWLGTWDGVFQGDPATWPRFYDKDGNLVPIFVEAEKQRAEAEKQRAEAAERELAQLKARLAEIEQRSGS